MAKTWRELLSDDDAIDLVREWAASAPTEVSIVSATDEAGQATLEGLQVSTRSPLGAVAYHTGGILVDRGWLRILGSGSSAVPRTLVEWNRPGANQRHPRGLLVADDAIGGFFAWHMEPRTIHYFSPDTLDWEDLGVGYSDWLSWALSERLQAFYADLRWPDWEAEVEPLTGDLALHIWPPLVTKGPESAQRSRRAVPVEELWSLGMELQEQLAGLADGESFRVVVR